jgi:hypothetical protein
LLSRLSGIPICVQTDNSLRAGTARGAETKWYDGRLCKGLESHIPLISLKGRESGERTLLPTKPSLAGLEQTAEAVTTHLYDQASEAFAHGL